MNTPIRSIVVAGGGPVALVAAVALARALPQARVMLLPMPIASDALADRLPLALPTNEAMLLRLGLDPARLVEEGIATPRLATRFTDWGAPAPWLVGEGMALAHPGLPIHQLWLRAAGGGPVPAFHALVPACVVALAGRTLPPDIDPASALAPAAQALHLDARRLGAALAALARAARVAVAPPGTTIAAVEAGPDGIAALHLADGGRIGADLFVDATGPARHLAGAVSVAREDWSAALPATRLLLAPSRALSPEATSIDDYRARPTGWHAQWPGAAAAAFRVRENEAAARLALGDAGAGAELVTVQPERLVDGWTGNVLSLGEAAAQPGPLALPGFALALDQLALALDLLPDRRMEPLMLAEYNRRAGLRADRVRDAAAALYVAGNRPRGGFWMRATRAAVPEPLAGRLALFARRGTIRPQEEDGTERDRWAAMLLGRGIRPQLADPAALALPEATARRRVQAMADDLARAVARLPFRPGGGA